MLKKPLYLVFFILGACTGKEEPKYQPTPYVLSVPEGFPEMVIPDDNPMTVEGIDLGRRLYYDPMLQQAGEKACATCHVQQNSFSSDDFVLPAVNLGWSRNFLWEGKVKGTVEDIMRHEVENFFETDVEPFKNDPDYPGLFKKAFGSDEITREKMVFALSQFVRTLISGNSKFDQYLRGEVQLSNLEYRGYELFYTEEGDCFHCHASVFMTDNNFHNNALDSLPDPGYFLATGDSLDYGKFKSPTLRNIEYTAPYMHDGRFATLEEVVDFYSSGLMSSPTVDPLMKQLGHGGVQLSPEDKDALVAFLKTLTDPDFIANPDFSNPNN